ncbi:MAG TPA: alpha/beta fold hydrolase [Verrucomicrobiae bacterium]|nr:alpha/beta fold hydrolase [Verrucomicrobiae bacterium]
MSSITRFADPCPPGPAVRGWLHRPSPPSGDGVLLAHGAGSNADSPILVAMAEALAGAGWTVLRCDLPFRQERPTGPPHRGAGERDRAGLRNAGAALRTLAPRRLVLGGHSYGGRQASMLAAEAPGLADALLLLSYPLHPPRKPREARTAHFGALRTPAVFVHGTRDGFGTVAELEAARAGIPVPTRLLVADGAGHDLGGGARGRARLTALAGQVLDALRALLGQPVGRP